MQEQQYFIETAVRMGWMGADTAWFLQHSAKDSNRIFEQAEAQSHLLFDQFSIKRFQHHAGVMQEHYLQWRASGEDCLLHSLVALQGTPILFEEISSTVSNHILDYGFNTIKEAMPLLEARFNLSHMINVLTTSLHRGWQDLNQCSDQRIAGLIQESQALSQGNYGSIQDQWRNDQSISQLALGLELMQVLSNHPTINGDTQIKDQSCLKNNGIRRAVRRSAEFLSSVAGESTTRAFLTQGMIRVEGQHCTFEIRKNGSLSSGQPGPEAFLVLSKDNPATILCKICLLTPGVPLMDHVASLIMHIRAGLEEEIFKSGRINSVHPQAWKCEWLTPYLPKPPKYNIPQCSEPGLLPSSPRKVTNLDLVKEVRAEVKQWLFNLSFTPEKADLTAKVYNPDYPRFLLPNQAGWDCNLLEVADAYRWCND